MMRMLDTGQQGQVVVSALVTYLKGVGSFRLLTLRGLLMVLTALLA